jgi:hypothetical protein
MAELAQVRSGQTAITEDADAKKQAAIAARVDGQISLGFVRDVERDDAIFMLSEHPERGERIYMQRAEKLVPIGVSQAGLTNEDKPKPPSVGGDKVTFADLNEHERTLHMSTMSAGRSIGMNYDADRVARNIAAARAGKKN